jgi:heparin/heparan-sulfate lyase
VWWTYCVKPNGEWPRIDDTGSVRGSIQPWHFKYLATRYRDGISIWQLEQLPPSDPPTSWDVIWDPSGLDIQSTDPDKSWPLARHFEGIGWVVLRSGWDSTAAYSVFDCGDFYYGHQHPAENAFTIFRGGSLAINSGRYEWGSDHRPNYMVRTIASNSVLVYDPGEVFLTSRGDTLSNDGGQQWPRPERREFGEMSGTQWDTGQIIAFETNPWYSYVCGDASASYSNHKLKRFTRQYIHLQPDMFVVFDRVESTQADYRKYWLLHTVNEPVNRDGWLVANEREGLLYVRTILPGNARIEKIGGEGKEFWVFGSNYPPGMTHYSPREGEQWGSWRIQTSASQPAQNVEFLHILYAAHKTDNNPPRVEMSNSANHRPGVEISHNGRIYKLLFDSTGQPGGDVVVMDDNRNILLEKRLSSVVQPQQGIGN